MYCYGEKSDEYAAIIHEGIDYLKSDAEIGGDELKCYLLTYGLLKRNDIEQFISLDDFKQLLSEKLKDIIYKDTSLYGVEYVPLPSDFFVGIYSELITPDIIPLIQTEKELLSKLQLQDGGFDISWKWHTPYSEFETARSYWCPRITIDKLLFYTNN